MGGEFDVIGELIWRMSVVWNGGMYFRIYRGTVLSYNGL